MTDYRSMFDRKFVAPFDLARGDAVVVIERVKGETLKAGSEERKRPVVWLKGQKLAFPLNKTNAKAIAGMYGTNVEEWVGKPISIYATTTQFGRDTVQCIRVRPTPPKGKPEQQPQPTAAKEPGDES